MWFPPKCGNWAHIPIDIPEDDSVHGDLKNLGFRYGRPCNKSSGIWRHVHPPTGWYYQVAPNGTAEFWDNNGHERVSVWLPSMTPEKKSRIIMRRYHSIICTTEEEENLSFVVVDICNPYGEVAYRGFELIPPAMLGSQARLMSAIHGAMWRVYAMFLHVYPQASQPLAYWDTP